MKTSMTIEQQFKLALKSIALAQSEYSPKIAELITDWQLVQVSQPMKTSLGKAFDTDEITIGKRPVPDSSSTETKILTWSFLNQCLVKIPSQYGHFIETTNPQQVTSYPTASECIGVSN